MKEKQDMYERYASVRLQDRGVKITDGEIKLAFERLSVKGVISIARLKYFLIKTKIKIFGDHSHTNEENIKDFLSIVAPDGAVNFETFKNSIASFPFLNMLIHRVAGFTAQEISDITNENGPLLIEDPEKDMNTEIKIGETVQKTKKEDTLRVDCELCRNFHLNNHFKSKSHKKCNIF
eukprot:GAHX01001150.1.p1 GENE.GAHX01001150.1~~GAHX01001150.1.p1  ORF type:complete len:178 (-),score=39.92 GAHX01001150.1:40-573(-)